MPGWPKPSEKVVLVVNGREFVDWETVSVKHEQGGRPPYVARFTVSEPLPLSKNLGVLQIKPGDLAVIYLAGQHAFTGYIHTRQVYIDANRHHVELIAATFINIINGSVIFPNMETKNKTLGENARKVLDPLGIKTVFENGTEPVYRIPRASVTPGISVYDWLDMLSQNTPTETGLGLRITSNPNGDFVFIMKESDQTDVVTEGDNMIVGREIIFNPSVSTAYPVLSQGPGNNQRHGPQVTHMPFFNKGENSSFQGGLLPKIVWASLPTSDMEVLKGRNSNESGWNAADEITIWLTVHGWLRKDGKLFDRNQQIIVNSESLMMRGDKFKVKSLTFTQTNQTGTRTEIELANDAARGGTTPPIQ